MSLHVINAVHSSLVSLEAQVDLILNYDIIVFYGLRLYESVFTIEISGLALITMNDARLWTDGRYFLQASQQLKGEWKLMRIGEDPALEVWMVDVSLPKFLLYLVSCGNVDCKLLLGACKI